MVTPSTETERVLTVLYPFGSVLTGRKEVGRDWVDRFVPCTPPSLTLERNCRSGSVCPDPCDRGTPLLPSACSRSLREKTSTGKRGWGRGVVVETPEVPWGCPDRRGSPTRSWWTRAVRGQSLCPDGAVGGSGGVPPCHGAWVGE